MQHETPLKNPLGWAEKAVGSRLKYCLSVGTTIGISLMLLGHYVLALVREPMSFVSAVSYASLVFAGAIVWPLCFIKALRVLVVERRKAEEATRGAAAGGPAPSAGPGGDDVQPVAQAAMPAGDAVPACEPDRIGSASEE